MVYLTDNTPHRNRYIAKSTTVGCLVIVLLLSVICFFTYFAFIQVAANKPKLDDLNRDVRPKVAEKWYDLGIQLLSGVENGVDQLRIILKNKPADVEACCTEMFRFWLNNVNDASWEKMAKAVEIIGHIVLAEDLRKVSIYIKIMCNTDNLISCLQGTSHHLIYRTQSPHT